MPVDIEGDLDAGMAHLIADVLGALSLRDQHGREKMPEVVEANPVEAGLLEDGRKDPCVEVIGIDHGSAGTAEKPNLADLPLHPAAFRRLPALNPRARRAGRIFAIWADQFPRATFERRRH
jgi:hypothetical protein